jgi:hypothetical protein
MIYAHINTLDDLLVTRQLYIHSKRLHYLLLMVKFLRPSCMHFSLRFHKVIYTDGRLVVWWSECLATNPEVLGSIPDHIFCEVVGLELGSLSHVWTIEQLLGRNSSGSDLRNREYGRGDTLRWPRDTLYSQNLVPSLRTSVVRSLGIVLSWTKAMEFKFLFLIYTGNPISSSWWRRL